MYLIFTNNISNWNLSYCKMLSQWYAQKRPCENMNYFLESCLLQCFVLPKIMLYLILYRKQISLGYLWKKKGKNTLCYSIEKEQNVKSISVSFPSDVFQVIIKAL